MNVHVNVAGSTYSRSKASGLSSPGEAAVEYAERGWCVFPLKQDTKGSDAAGRSTHLLPNGHNGASNAPDQVRRWWTAWPDANIGLSLAASGLVAVDADTYKPGCGWNTLVAGNDIPTTLIQKSASGGTHYVFTASPGEVFEGEAAPFVDIKHKGYILVEPSTFEGKPYRFETDDDPAPCPDWVPRKKHQAAGPAEDTERGEPYGPGDLLRVRKLLVDAENKLERGKWIKLALALKGVFGDDVREDFLAFSYRWPDTEQGDPQRVWANARPNGKVGLGTVFWLLGGGGTDLTEDGVALSFTGIHAERLRFDHDAGLWYEWTGDRWRQDGTGLAFSWCREVARKLADGAAREDQARVRKKSFAAGVDAFARTDRTHAVTQDVWDAEPFHLGCPGGVVDLRTGRLLPANQQQRITKHVAVKPAATADCPQWLAFLKQATGGDEGMVEFLRRWCGYCLTGDTREHALIFLYGPGGNGKSVFLNTVSRIMGDYAKTAAMDTFTASRGDKHPTELAMLRGARMVSASETEEGRAWAESKIKQMTGGDPITARFMRQDFFTFLPSFKLTIVGNHAPALANVDDAARRRFNIVPFTFKPAAPDRQLEGKLKAEWPAILRWMVEGTLTWQRDGLAAPDSVRAATAEYFSEQDLTARWLDEACVCEPGNEYRWETAADLFASWTVFAKTNGEDVGTAKSMAPRLRRHGLQQMRKAGGTRCWAGVSISGREGRDHD